jgi:hypothetical protein
MQNLSQASYGGPCKFCEAGLHRLQDPVCSRIQRVDYQHLGVLARFLGLMYLFG